MPPIKIAIYSGTVPSTVFIERLIKGVAAGGNVVYLFGKKEKSVGYPKNAKQFTYGSKPQKFFLLLWYSVLLFLFRFKDKKKLDAFIGQQNGSAAHLKTKYYPVLYHRPDIFHLQWAKGIADWLWVREFGIKLLLSLRGTHLSISPIADTELAGTYKRCFPLVDGFHAVSETMAKEAMKYGAAAEKIKTVRSGLDLNSFAFQPKAFNPQTIKICSVGRAHWVKGYHYALDACAPLMEKGRKFHYTLIGLDENEELLFQRKQLGLEEVVTFKKKEPFEKTLAAISDADILLLPSVAEGIANVALEAMALGTLVVSASSGGMPELINNGENGFLVPARSPEALATAIEKAMDLTKEEHFRLLKNARTGIEQHFSETQMVSGMQELYDLVLNGK